MEDREPAQQHQMSFWALAASREKTMGTTTKASCRGWGGRVCVLAPAGLKRPPGAGAAGVLRLDAREDR